LSNHDDSVIKRYDTNKTRRKDERSRRLPDTYTGVEVMYTRTDASLIILVV